MKITQTDVIRSGEKELIDIITGDLDWQQIETILERKYGLRLSDGPAVYRRGDIVVHNNQVAYQLEFEATVKLSVLFDRQGECVDVVSEAVDRTDDAESGRDSSGDDAGDAGGQPPGSAEGQADLAADIAGMIAEINED